MNINQGMETKKIFGHDSSNARDVHEEKIDARTNVHDENCSDVNIISVIAELKRECDLVRVEAEQLKILIFKAEEKVADTCLAHKKEISRYQNLLQQQTTNIANEEDSIELPITNMVYTRKNDMLISELSIPTNIVSDDERTMKRRRIKTYVKTENNSPNKMDRNFGLMKLRYDDEDDATEDETIFSDGSCSVTDQSETLSSEKLAKKVSFSSIEIRKYPIILGDHPNCKEGAPISIDWNYFEKNNHALDEYESTRSESRRSRKELVVGPNTRAKILKEESGVTDERIRYAIMGVNRVRQGRYESLNCKQLRWEIKKNQLVHNLLPFLASSSSKNKINNRRGNNNEKSLISKPLGSRRNAWRSHMNINRRGSRISI